MCFGLGQHVRLFLNKTHSMYDVASSSAALTAFYADAGTLIALAVGVVLGALAALLGLGWGIRTLKKHITGKKF